MEVVRGFCKSSPKATQATTQVITPVSYLHNKTRKETPTESKCDFCEGEDETCSFEPEWDAFICDTCSEELEKQMKEFRERLSKHE